MQVKNIFLQNLNLFAFFCVLLLLATCFVAKALNRTILLLLKRAL